MHRRLWNALIVLVVLTSSGGCRQKEESPQTLKLDGKIEKITAQADGTGEITINYFSKKHNKTAEGVGEVTAETRILINDKPGTITDLRVGERVYGEVLVRKNGEEKRMIALEIHVDRAVLSGG